MQFNVLSVQTFNATLFEIKEERTQRKKARKKEMKEEQQNEEMS